MSARSMTAPPQDSLGQRLMGFVRFLRDNGYPVGVREGLDALTLAGACGPADRQRLSWGLRSLLCSNAGEWDRFDELFRLYWLPANRRSEVRASASRRSGQTPQREPAPAGSGATAEVEGGAAGDGGACDEGASRGGASRADSHAGTDFRFLQDGQAMRETEALAERLALRMRRRLIRRQRVQQHGRRIHLRRTLRNSLRYGGTPLELAFRSRRKVLPRLVLILDVSRSMSLYSYFFLRFARGIVAAFKDAQAFVLHTRLVHVTEALRERDLHRLKSKLAVLSLGWSGGTRIGESLQTFNRDYARRLLGSRSVVIVLSDGLDTGEPEALGDALARIRRRARRVLWLNPLLGRDGYAPLAAGMQAALPWIDLFAPAHNLESLQALESQIINA